MNLVEVEIRDYRQFLGENLFSPAQQGMIGVIGDNGAGKTTLFEAIEWCLYNPASIRNDDIRPRIQGGKPRVKVTLEHPQSGERYEIERELRSRTVTAAVYRSDQPETPIVQGTRQVSEYVAKTLLGLSHQAFVATFFTRQKELSFFGSFSATDRRREVGKLLGLETIRVAQQAIGQQRQDKQNEARQRKQIHEDQSAGRDFAEERTGAQALIDQRTSDVETIGGKVSEVFAELSRVRERLQEENERSGKHHGLTLELTSLTGTRELKQSEFETLSAQITEIERAGLQIGRLTPLAETAESLAQRLLEHEDARKLGERIAETKRRIEDLKRDERSIHLNVADAASRIDAGVSRRIGEAEDAADANEIERLLSIATSADAATKQAMLAALERCIDLSHAAEQAARTLTTYIERAGEIEAEITKLRVNGDPGKEVERAVADVTAARKEESTFQATIVQREQTRTTLNALRERLKSGQFDEPCATCGRPYAPDDLERSIAALSEQISSLTLETKSLQAQASEAGKRAGEAAQRETAARDRLQQLSRCESRLELSRPHIEDAQHARDESATALAAALNTASRTTVPTESEVANANRQLVDAQNLEKEARLLEQLRRDLQENVKRIEATSTELASLGPNRYDRDAHSADTNSWRQASEAAAQIALLRERAATLPSKLQLRVEAETAIEDIAGQIGMTETALDDLAFSPETHDAFRTEEASKRDRYEELLNEQHNAKGLLTSAMNALQAIETEEARLQGMLQRSIDAQLAADELDRMYREFSRFEQYVARSVTPALAEITSHLVSTVTEGKYDRVEFSEDFGIEVFDGDDDHFPLSQFSGGERDVIALCARLALSQFLGGQSTSPPQFVVMDEVFGSLDRNRRENLMSTLNLLLDETGTFKQLFVISHVDDVRVSAAFDEIWRVEEGAGGVSQIEQLGAGSVPVEL